MKLPLAPLFSPVWLCYCSQACNMLHVWHILAEVQFFAMTGQGDLGFASHLPVPFRLSSHSIDCRYRYLHLHLPRVPLRRPQSVLVSEAPSFYWLY